MKHIFTFDFSWPLIGRVFHRNLKVFLKTWKANIMFNFVEPILYLWAMGVGLGIYVTQINGLPYIKFLAPGLIASSTMFSTSYEMTYDSFTRMNHQRIYHAIAATPVSMDDVVLGEILYGTFKGVLYGIVFSLVTFLFGVIKHPLALLVPIPLIFLALGFSILSLIWTSLAPNYDSFGYFFTLLVSPMFLFSGIFFPIESLPQGVRILAWFTPLFHAVEAIRPLALGQFSPKILGHLAWLAIFSLLFLPLPLKLVKRRLIQ